VTIAIAPRLEQDGAGYRFDLGKARRKMFLLMRLDSGTADLPVEQNQVVVRIDYLRRGPARNEYTPQVAINRRASKSRITRFSA
jgi:hypothetical protein